MKRSLLALTVVALPLTWMGPAEARAEPAAGESVFVTHDDVELNPDGESWTLVHRSSGNFVASWEKSGGLWESVDEAFAAVESEVTCSGKAAEKILRSYDTYAALQDSGIVEFIDEETWAWAEGKVPASVEECASDSAWTWAETPSERLKDGTTEVRIPLSKIGPGTHELFLLELERTGCGRVDYEDGWVESQCFTPGLKSTTAVVIPEPISASRTALPSAHPGGAGSSDDESVWANPLIWGGLGGLVAGGIGIALLIVRRRRAEGRPGFDRVRQQQ